MIIKFLKPELTVWTVLKNRKFVFVKKTSSSYLSQICYASKIYYMFAKYSTVYTQLGRELSWW